MKYTTPYRDLFPYNEKRYVGGLYTSLFCVIIPTLFPYFLRFWYPYILLHFKCFLLLVYVIFFSSRRMHTGLWHLHCQQWLKNQTQASQKPTLFWMDTKPVFPVPELKTIAKYSVAKIAIPDSSSDTLLSL